jgi:hypothetical protein
MQAPAATRDEKQVDELKQSLAAKEQELAAAQEQVGVLTAKVGQQQEVLSARMADSQASSMELNELLTGERAKNESLAARLAQADQRLLRSQEELAQLRTRYRADVEQVVAERQDVERAMSKNKDQGLALLAARERELERQQLRVASLEKALSDMTRQAQLKSKGAATTDAQRVAESERNRAALAALQARVDEQQRQLKARQDELASLRARSKQDKAAVEREMAEQLSRRTAELEAKQRRLVALTSETDMLRSEVVRLNAQRERDAAGASDEATRARASLRVAQQTLNEQRERLDQLLIEKATDVAALA